MRITGNLVDQQLLVAEVSVLQHMMLIENLLRQRLRSTRRSLAPYYACHAKLSRLTHQRIPLLQIGWNHDTCAYEFSSNESLKSRIMKHTAIMAAIEEPRG